MIWREGKDEFHYPPEPSRVDSALSDSCPSTDTWTHHGPVYGPQSRLCLTLEIGALLVRAVNIFLKCFTGIGKLQIFIRKSHPVIICSKKLDYPVLLVIIKAIIRIDKIETVRGKQKHGLF